MPTNNPPQEITGTTTQRTFLGLPSQIPELRRYLRKQLGDHPRTYDALVIGNELSTNAIEHTDSRKPAGAFTTTLTTRTDGTLRIEVTDQGGPDHFGLPRHEREGGRGLPIIEALAEEWGITGDPTGRTVWAELAAEPPPERPAPDRPANRPTATKPAPLTADTLADNAGCEMLPAHSTWARVDIP